MVLSSFSVTEMLSLYENWIISVDKHSYIHLQFDTFDIGCQAGSVLEIVYASSDKRVLCNRKNRPVFALRSRENQLQISFYLFKKPGELINVFAGHYIARSIQSVSLGLLTKRQTGKHDITFR